MKLLVIFFIIYIYELYSFPQEDVNKPESCASDQTRCIFGVYGETI